MTAGLVSLLAVALAAADPIFAVQLEGGVGHFVNSPQSSYFGVSEAVSLRADLRLFGPLSVQASGSFINVETRAAFFTGPGRLLQAGAGLKLRPLRWLWFDAQLLVVGTGPLVRFGYELGAGATFFPTGFLGLGPYVRWLHVVQPDSPGVDGNDALMLHAGVAVCLRLPFERAEPAAIAPPPTVTSPPTVVPTAPPEPAEAASGSIARPVKGVDTDLDGIPDSRDACPNAPETFNAVDDDDGCSDPQAGPAVVTLSADRIELVGAVRYDRSGHVDQGSLPLVVTLGRVLALHPDLSRVRLEVTEPGLELARQHAAALLRVLLDLGLPPERLEAEGLRGKSGLEVRVLQRE